MKCLLSLGNKSSLPAPAVLSGQPPPAWPYGLGLPPAEALPVIDGIRPGSGFLSRG